MRGLSIPKAPTPSGGHTSYMLVNIQDAKVAVFPEENFLGTTQLHQFDVRQALGSIGLELCLTVEEESSS